MKLWRHGAICIAAWACNAPQQAVTWEMALDTLPGGILRVVNSPSSDGAAEWTLEEVLRVGAIDADGPTSFSGIRGLAVLDDGGFAVLDAIPQELRIFDGDGRHRATFGGKGGGPGELEAGFGLMRDDEGRLWIPDTQNARMSVFDPQLGFESSAPLNLLSYAFVWRGAMMNDGQIWKPSITLGRRGENVMRVFNAEMALVDSLAMPPDAVVDPTDAPGTFYWEAPGGRARSYFSVPFFPQGEQLIDPAGAVWSTDYGNPSYRITRWVPGGDTTLVVETRRRPVEIPASARDSAIAAVLEQLRARGATQQDWSKVPTIRAAVRGMFLSGQSDLWVLTDLESGQVFDVYDRTGRHVRTVANPFGIYRSVRPVVRGDEFWGVVTDDLEVQYVVRARIVPVGAE